MSPAGWGQCRGVGGSVTGVEVQGVHGLGEVLQAHGQVVHALIALLDLVQPTTLGGLHDPGQGEHGCVCVSLSPG